MITAAVGSSPVANSASATRLLRISADTAGADHALPCATNRHSASPIRRLTSAHTCSGSSRASRRAPSPTTCSPRRGEQHDRRRGRLPGHARRAPAAGRPGRCGRWRSSWCRDRFRGRPRPERSYPVAVVPEPDPQDIADKIDDVARLLARQATTLGATRRRPRARPGPTCRCWWSCTRCARRAALRGHRRARRRERAASRPSPAGWSGCWPAAAARWSPRPPASRSAGADGGGRGRRHRGPGARPDRRGRAGTGARGGAVARCARPGWRCTGSGPSSRGNDVAMPEPAGASCYASTSAMTSSDTSKLA